MKHNLIHAVVQALAARGGLFLVLVHATLRLHGAPSLGTIDPTFEADIKPGPLESVASVIHDPQGRLLVSAGSSLVRLLPDGSRDPSYPVSVSDGPLRTLTLLPDGTLYVGGDFRRFAGIEHVGIVRLRPDGTLDPTFATMTPLDRRDVLTIVVQSSGRIIVGGTFNGWDSRPVPNIVRLEPDGTLEPSFADNIAPAFSTIVSNVVTIPGSTNDAGWILAVGRWEPSPDPR